MTDDPLLARFAAALAPVPGLAALVLGGSRGRGAAGAHSDYDLGLYYEPEAPLESRERAPPWRRSPTIPASRWSGSASGGRGSMAAPG